MTETDPQAPHDDGPEVPEEDAIEQRTDTVETEPDDDPTAADPEADPADVAEQSRTVDLDDDEYR